MVHFHFPTLFFELFKGCPLSYRSENVTVSSSHSITQHYIRSFLTDKGRLEVCCDGD